MDKINNFLIQRTALNPDKQIVQPKNQNTSNSINFQDVLNQKINQNSDLKISKHAELRMKSRNINLSQEQMDRVKNGAIKAEEKGVKESLIMVDNIAMVVSIKNKTIITVTDSKELKDNVFTNIDGAVII